MLKLRNVYILAEVNPGGSVSALTIELLDLGKKISSQNGGSVCVFLLGNQIDQAGREISSYGEKVIAVDDENLKDYNPAVFLPLMEDLLNKNVPADTPYLLMGGHTALGQDLLPRVAYARGAGLATDCTGIRVDEGYGDCVVERFIYGGNVVATQAIKSDLAAVTVRSRVGDAPDPVETVGEIVYPEVDVVSEPAVRVKEKNVASRELELEDAPVVVSGGRGMGGEDGFSRLNELASVLNGAVGATRPPVDNGWISPTRQVGITGKIVAPQIYMAVALSGSTQHISGMSEAKTVVSINKDPEAYIFKVSDYGVVGNWEEVLPPFLDELKTYLY